MMPETIIVSVDLIAAQGVAFDVPFIVMEDVDALLLLTTSVDTTAFKLRRLGHPVMCEGVATFANIDVHLRRALPPGEGHRFRVSGVRATTASFLTLTFQRTQKDPLL